MKVRSGCHCGELQFTAEVDPSRVTVCHCTDCQTISGTAFRVVVQVPMNQFHLAGTPKAYVKRAESGRPRALMFCASCGTHVYGTEPEQPTVASIRVGCIAEREQLPPARQVWCRSALPWLPLLPQLPASAQQ